MAHVEHTAYRHDSIIPYAEERGQSAPRGCILAETCVASIAFVESLQEMALAEARAAAEEALKQRKASKAAASAPAEGDHTERQPVSFSAALQNLRFSDPIISP